MATPDDGAREENGFLRRLTRWLDDYAIDPILGLLLPGAGDAITGLASTTILLAALRERVPTVILLRMLLNIAVDVAVGAIPLFGDAFDFVWRANRRNLALLDRHRGGEGAPSVADYAIVGLALLLVFTAVALPFVFAARAFRAIERLLG